MDVEEDGAGGGGAGAAGADVSNGARGGGSRERTESASFRGGARRWVAVAVLLDDVGERHDDRRVKDFEGDDRCRCSGLDLFVPTCGGWVVSRDEMVDKCVCVFVAEVCTPYKCK